MSYHHPGRCLSTEGEKVPVVSSSTPTCVGGGADVDGNSGCSKPQPLVKQPREVCRRSTPTAMSGLRGGVGRWPRLPLLQRPCARVDQRWQLSSRGGVSTSASGTPDRHLRGRLGRHWRGARSCCRGQCASRSSAQRRTGPTYLVESTDSTLGCNPIRRLAQRHGPTRLSREIDDDNRL